MRAGFVEISGSGPTLTNKSLAAVSRSPADAELACPTRGAEHDELDFFAVVPAGPVGLPAAAITVAIGA